MADKQCPQQYYTRMASSANDKAKIADFIQDGDKVLDVGAGGGVLAELLLNRFPAVHITALDASDTATERLNELKQRFADRLTVVQCDFFEYQPECRFDVVVFCSTLHELFSYCRYNGELYRPETVTAALKCAANLLVPGKGRIIIRDGIASSHNPRVLVQYHDAGLQRLAERFESEFEGFSLGIVHSPWGDIMPYNSMRELLYTITWGPDSFDREVKEWYGYYSLADWKKEELRLCASCGLVLVHLEKYLQPGYKEHLQGKVSVLSAPRLHQDATIAAKPIEFPASNCLVVFSNQYV